MPTCVACESPLLPGRAFCGDCGTPAPAAAPALPTCRCGAVLTGPFCGDCGTPRDQAAPADPAPAATPTWTQPSARTPRPQRQVRHWPAVAIAVAVLVMAAAWFLGPLAPVEALILLTLVLIAIALVAGLTAGRSPAPGPLTDPSLGSRELVYSRYGVEHGPLTADELARVAAAEGLPDTTQVRDTSGGAWFPLGELVRTTSTRSYGTTFTLAFFLGALGAHWFYLGRPGLGLLRLLAWAGTMAVAIAAVVEAGETTSMYDPYSGSYYASASDVGDLLVGVYAAAAVLTVWTLLDLVLVGTRSVRDGQGRRLP